jgi:glycosyltransferase involved in cell wall biosynthesis
MPEHREPRTVLSIAFPFAPVGPHAVGGAERILSDLDEALVARGHRSLVVACAGSRPAGRLFSVALPPASRIDNIDRRAVTAACQAAIDRALASHPVDLVHMHGMELHDYRFPADLPVLMTLHLPIAWYSPALWHRDRSQVRFQCVSRNQRSTCPPDLGDIAVIENGVAVPPARESSARSPFALALGRICPEKNLHAALDAGTRAGIPVWIGGHVFAWRDHQQYFREEIQPRLDRSGQGAQHRFLGPLLPERRQRLLQRALCLLHPTLAPETSSLVAMEAMAAGTPVIAWRSGALADLVEHGITGFLVESTEEMAEAIGRVSTIFPETCRARAAARFSLDRMIREYFSLYESLLQHRPAEHLCA